MKTEQNKLRHIAGYWRNIPLDNLLRHGDVIRNLHTSERFTVLKVADTGEPIINTRSGKIRVPWSSYERHYRNVTTETFRANK